MKKECLAPQCWGPPRKGPIGPAGGAPSAALQASRNKACRVAIKGRDSGTGRAK
jgi:hypothetical protein